MHLDLARRLLEKLPKGVALDPRGTASLLGVSIHTLQAYRSQGRGGPPWRKEGARVEYPLAELVRFMETKPSNACFRAAPR